MFSVDAFAGGLVVNSLLALWLFERFGRFADIRRGLLFLGRPAGCVFATGGALDGRRIGLLNTMVFTHIPASLFLILCGFGAELCRWQ